MALRGKIQFLPLDISKIVRKKLLMEHVRKAAELNADMIVLSLARSKDIVTGGNFKHLEQGSTIPIRQRRGISGTTPLIETGNLLKSVTVSQDGDGYSITLEGAEYGHQHNSGFVTAPDSMIPSKEVRMRRFFDTPKAFFRRKEYLALFSSLNKQIKKKLKQIPVTRIG